MKAVWELIKETAVWLWSLDTRTAEWLIGNVFIARAFAMWAPGDAHSDALYGGFKAIIPYDHIWGTVYFVMGVTLWTSIIYNGRVKYSPYVRAAACSVGSAILAMMTVVFTNTWSITAAALYGSLAISCSYCVFNIASKIPIEQR